VSLGQLRSIGLSEAGVRARVRSGRLYRLHQGVYAVGHPGVSREGRWYAAVLACGDGAVLSHRSAAALLGIRPDNRRRIDVTSPARGGRDRPGIDAHSAATLLPSDITHVDRIPVTTVPRTLLDLAETIDQQGLERAIERAEQLRIFDLNAIQDVLRRAHGRRGTPRLIAALKAEPIMAKSKLERIMYGICRRAGVPLPNVNHEVEGEEVDFSWPDHKEIIETDGWQTHGTRTAFENDRARDLHLKLNGWNVTRLSWRQVAYQPDLTANFLRNLLAA
jgi:hypothetical protein